MLCEARSGYICNFDIYCARGIKLKETILSAPVEINPWTDVYNATLEHDVCPQIQQGKYDGSEDCLHLNVYTPKLDFTKKETVKPVLVWIHGGAFRNGANAKDVYGPDRYIEEDVIMVAMKYRLGPLGFLSLDHPDARG
ncbi:juvenile hormone esterase-like, partial [Hylaeus anthracinus]|uniref:juvenile hormone esterase-like n=1 Tax=Hylaeus anthracinus TaxID=313031 RepID=UPI0023B98950